MPNTTDLLLAAGIARRDAERLDAPAPSLSGDLGADWAAFRDHLAARAELLRRLPAKPSRSAAEQAAAAALLDEGRLAREAFLRRHAAAVYDRLTLDRRRLLRLHDLVYAAAAELPGLVPTLAEIAREREHPQAHQDGVQVDQGIFLAHVFADPDRGAHLLHAMGQPTPAALERLGAFRASGRAELPPMTLERRGKVGHVTFHHQAWLNAEDEEYQGALELLVDLVLLDDAIEVGVLRGGPMTKAKWAGRRVFGAGINLTQLYHGKISLVGFMLTRETGPLAKIHRGLARPEVDPSEQLEDRIEKPFIGAVDAFAIGGHCQLLLILDRVIAEAGAWLSLPARKEGIIPGLANLRLPRFVGERAARQRIFFEGAFPADGPLGRMICDEVVQGEEQMQQAIAAAAAELVGAGTRSLIANRRALRVATEPLHLLRQYLAVYSREQAYCLHDPAMIENLIRNWNAQQRRSDHSS